MLYGRTAARDVPPEGTEARIDVADLNEPYKAIVRAMGIENLVGSSAMPSAVQAGEAPKADAPTMKPRN